MAKCNKEYVRSLLDPKSQKLFDAAFDANMQDDSIQSLQEAMDLALNVAEQDATAFKEFIKQQVFKEVGPEIGAKLIGQIDGIQPTTDDILKSVDQPSAEELINLESLLGAQTPVLADDDSAGEVAALTELSNDASQKLAEIRQAAEKDPELVSEEERNALVNKFGEAIRGLQNNLDKQVSDNKSDPAVRKFYHVLADINQMHFQVTQPEAFQKAKQNVHNPGINAAAREMANTMLFAKTPNSKVAYKHAQLIEALLDPDNQDVAKTISQAARFMLENKIFPSPTAQFLANRVAMNNLKGLRALVTGVANIPSQLDGMEKGDNDMLQAPSGMELFRDSKREPTSVLQLVPMFAEVMQDMSLRRSTIDIPMELKGEEMGQLNNFLTYESEFKEAVDEIAPPIFAPNNQDDVLTRHSGKYAAEWMESDPLYYFRDMEGKLPRNLVTMMAMELQNWIASMGQQTIVNSNKDIAQILGKDDGLGINYAEVGPVLTKAGTLRRNAVMSIGRAIWNQMGLQETELTPGFTKEKLIASLGSTAITAAAEMGMVEFNQVGKAWFSEHAGLDNEEVNAEMQGNDPEAAVNFVRVIPMSDDSVEMNGRAAARKRNMEDGQALFRRLFNTVDYARKPSVDKPTKVKTRIGKTTSHISKKLKELINRLQQVKYKPNPDAVAAINRFEDGEDFKVLVMGKQTDMSGYHNVELASVEGKNLQIDQSYNFAVEGVDEYGESGFYYTYDVKSNGRTMIESNTVNGQADKLHRAAFNPVNWKKNIKADLNNRAFQNFMVNVGLTLGIKVEDMSTSAAVEATMAKLAEPGVQAILDFIKSGKKFNEYMDGLSSDQQTELREAFEKYVAGEEAGHTFFNLETYARAEPLIGTGQTFVSYSGLETDGRSNGFAANLMQMVKVGQGGLSSTMRKMLNRVGIFMKDDPWNSFAEYKNDPDNMDAKDNYEELGYQSHQLIKKINNPETRAKVFDDIRAALEEKLDKTRDSKRALKLQKQLDNLAYAEDYMARSDKDPNMFHPKDFLDDLVEMTDSNEEKVTKAGRKFGKVLMVSAYGAGVAGIVRGLTQNASNQLYKKLMDGAKEGPKGLQDIVTKLNNSFGEGDIRLDPERLKEIDKLVKDNGSVEQALDLARDLMIPYEMINNFAKTVEYTYGAGLEQGLEHMIGDFTETRQNMNTAFRLMNEVYAQLYQNRVQAKEAEKGVALTDAEKQEIKQELLDQGLVPTSPYWMSDEGDYGSELQIVNEGLKPLQGDNQKAGHTRFKNGSVKVASQQRMSGGKPSQGRIMSNTLLENRPTGNPGVKGGVLNIQMSDSNTIAGVFGKFDITHIFDALMLDFENIDDATRLANETFFNLHKDWNVITNTREALNRFLPYLSENSELGAEAVQQILKNAYMYDKKKGIDGSLQAFLSDYNNDVQEVQKGREYLFDNIKSIDQFSKDGAQFKPDEQADTGTKQMRGVNYTNAFEEKFVEKFTGKLTEDTARELFKDFTENNTAPISAQHQEHLKRVLDNIVAPVLRKADLAIVHMENQDEKTHTGKYDKDEKIVYVETVADELTSPASLSAQEVLIHQYAYAVFDEAIDKDYWVRQQVDKLWQQAKEHLTVNDFMLPDAGNETFARMAAQERFDHIFNNPEGKQLQAFAAMMVSNEQLRKAMDKHGAREIKSKIFTGSPLDWIMNLFQKAADLVAGKAYKSNKGSITQSSDKLARRLMEISAHQVQKDYKITKKVDDANQRAKSFIGAQLEKLGNSERTGSKMDILRNAAKFGVEFNKNEHGQTQKWQGTASKLTGFSLHSGVSGALFSLAGEVLPRAFADLHPRDLLRKSKHLIDAQRERIANSTNKYIEEAFDPKNKLKDKHWEALNDTVLMTDMASLLEEFSVEEIINMLENPEQLRKEIQRISEELIQTEPQAGKAMVLQARGLGEMMATGVPGVHNQMSNAHAIANQMFLDEADHVTVSNTALAEARIDILASLEALQRTDNNVKQLTLEIANHEMARGSQNGFTNLIGMSGVFKEESLEKLFNGNKTQMIKGYVYEMYDPDLDLKFASPDEKTKSQMKKEGFKLVKTVAKDPDDTGSKDREVGIYVSQLGLSTYQKAVVSMTNMQKRGTDLFESMVREMGDSKSAAREARRQMGELKARKAKAAARQLKGDNGKNIPGMVPVLNEDGKIVNYRYMMAESTKRSVLGKRDRANKVMGHMFASINDRIESKAINREVVSQLAEEYRNYRKDKGFKFVFIGPNSDNKEFQDLYRMIPDDMRNQLKKEFGVDGMYVREEFIRTYFGFRKFTVSKFAQGNMAKALKMGENFLSEIMTLTKQRMVIVNPVVLGFNIVSNLFIHAVKGVPPIFAAKAMSEAIAGMRKYQNDMAKYDKLRYDISLNKVPDNAATQAKLAKYQRDIDENPVAALVKDGLFTNIVTEIEPDGGSNRKPITKLIESGKNLLPEGIIDRGPGALAVSGVREFYMWPGSKAYNMMLAAHQYSDFVSRYTQYKFDTQVRNVPKDVALNEALDTFIYYDEPHHPALQYLNDMGFAMFTKFFLRIQKVVGEMLINRPASSAAFLAAEAAMGGSTEDVYGYFLSSGGMINRFHALPLKEAWEQLGETTLIDWLEPMFKVFGE